MPIVHCSFWVTKGMPLLVPTIAPAARRMSRLTTIRIPDLVRSLLKQLSLSCLPGVSRSSGNFEEYYQTGIDIALLPFLGNTALGQFAWRPVPGGKPRPYQT